MAVIMLDLLCPSEILLYRSARVSYTVAITIAGILTPSAECRIATVSQRLTRSSIAEYSGCFQIGSKETVAPGMVAPSGFALI
jgi:hypothetical protein